MSNDSSLRSRERGCARSRRRYLAPLGLAALFGGVLFSPAAALGHSELMLYRNAQGELVLDGFTSGDAPVEESACLGGTCLYAGIDPGIVLADEDVPGEDRFALPAGTHVYLTVDAADPEVSVRYNGATGTSFDLGPAPGHVHAEWRLQLPEGVFGSYDLQIHFTADGYTGAPAVSLDVTNLGSAPTPTPSPPATPSPTSPPAATPTPTPTTQPATPSPTPRPTLTPALPPTPSPSPTRTPAPTQTPGATPPGSPTPAPTSSAAATPRPTQTPVGAPTPGATPSPAETPSETPTPRPADRPAGVRPGLDGETILVNKDVGAERWAITRNPDGTVTGNVFFADDRPPAFVFCEETEASGDTLLLACFGTERCGAAPCPPEAWSFLADVELPLRFFEPPSR